MATRQEEITIKLGGDMKSLMRELNMSRQQVQTFARETAKELTQGAVPQSWAAYKNYVKSSGVAAGRSLKETGGHVEGLAGKFHILTASIAAAFGMRAIREFIATIREVSAEIGKVYKELDTKKFLEERGEQRTKSLGKTNIEAILAGDVALDDIIGMAKTQVAKGAAAFSFAGGTVGEMFKIFKESKNPLDVIWGWGDAAEASAKNQIELIQKIKEANNVEKQKKDVEDLKKLQEQLDDAHFKNLTTLEKASDVRQKMRKAQEEAILTDDPIKRTKALLELEKLKTEQEDLQAKLIKEQTDQREKQIALQKKLADEAEKTAKSRTAERKELDELIKKLAAELKMTEAKPESGAMGDLGGGGRRGRYFFARTYSINAGVNPNPLLAGGYNPLLPNGGQKIIPDAEQKDQLRMKLLLNLALQQKAFEMIFGGVGIPVSLKMTK